MSLPRSLDELRGLRAARWTRESTGSQVDRFGPAAQRDQQDRAIGRYGLIDIGIDWNVAHSGRTIGNTSQWVDMLAAAGSTYDVLVVGYVSRFARDARTALNARHDLHAAGAAILFADEALLTSDEDRWHEWYRETGEAEAYSRKLSRRVREGFAAKRRLQHDPGSGEVSLGFRRVGGLVEPDPRTMPLAVEAYRLSAAGLSDREIADRLQLGIWPVRTVLRSALYGGHLPDGTSTRFPAPVPSDIVEQAQAQRRRRSWSGHQTGRHRIYPLTDRGPLVCASCDRPLKGVYRPNVQARLYRHPDPCEAWRPAEHRARVFEDQVAQLLRKASPNRESQARIRTALQGSSTMPDRLALARIDAELRRVALSLVERQDPLALQRLDELRTERAAVAEQPIETGQPTTEEALDYLSDLGKLWQETDDEGRRALAVAVFARLGAVSRRIVDLEVTPHAERRGLILALPTRVTGVGGTGALATPVTWPITIAHRREWLQAARTA